MICNESAAQYQVRRAGGLVRMRVSSGFSITGSRYRPWSWAQPPVAPRLALVGDQTRLDAAASTFPSRCAVQQICRQEGGKNVDNIFWAKIITRNEMGVS